MADAVGNKAAKDYHFDVPAPDQGFFARGLGHTDWGMKNRISHLFSPETGNTVMLAFDHGYIMGSTAGLERLDVTIAPLCEYADVLMGTRGAIRSCIPPTTKKAICLRATHDSSVLFEDMSLGSGLAMDMEDALRMNAAALAIQCFVGGAGERDSLEALRLQVRRARTGRHGRGQGDGTHDAVLPAGHAHPSGAGCERRQDLLLRGL